MTQLKTHCVTPILPGDSRVACRGQVFSAPMDWQSVMDQLDDSRGPHAALPHTGAILATMVSVHVEHGLVDLNKLLKQATVRRNVVVQLIRMLKDSGDPDYKDVIMERVEEQSKELADSDDPTIPKGLASALEGPDNEGDAMDSDMRQDKAATPTERLWTPSHFG